MVRYTNANFGNTGGFNGNISIEGNTNVGLNAIRMPNLDRYSTNQAEPDPDHKSTINSISRYFQTDLQVQANLLADSTSRPQDHKCAQARQAH